MPRGDAWTCECGTVNPSRSGYVRQWCRVCLRAWPGYKPAFDDLRAQNEALKALDRDVRMPAVEALRAENERLGKMARDRDDVIHGLAEHLRAALAVIDRYEDGIYKPAFDEEER